MVVVKHIFYADDLHWQQCYGSPLNNAQYFAYDLYGASGNSEWFSHLDWYEHWTREQAYGSTVLQDSPDVSSGRHVHLDLVLNQPSRIDHWSFHLQARNCLDYQIILACARIDRLPWR